MSRFFRALLGAAVTPGGLVLPQTGRSVRVTNNTSWVALANDVLGGRPGAWTFEAWIKKNTAAKQEAMASFFGGSLWLFNDSRRLRGNASGANTVISGEVVTLAEWQYAGISNDTATGGVSRIYRNGVKIAEGARVAHGLGQVGANRLMASPSSAAWWFDGWMCYARWWARQRTDAEIAADWDKLTISDTTGLVGCWPMNEGTGTTVVNYGSAGTAANGTLAGTAAYALDAPVLT